MQGFSLQPIPFFPEEGSVLLTESALFDTQVWGKMQDFLRNGGNIFVTTGFMRSAPMEQWKELSSAYLTGRTLDVTRYYKTDDPAGYLENTEPIRFADVQQSNNLSWSLLNGGEGEYHTTLFLKDTYGKGRLYLINTPENPSDLSRIPAWAFDSIKAVMNYDGVYVTAPNVSLFQYDNGVMVLYAHVTGQAHPVHATIHIRDKEAKLIRFNIPRSREKEKELELREQVVASDFQKINERVCDVIVEPGEFYAFRIER